MNSNGQTTYHAVGGSSGGGGGSSGPQGTITTKTHKWLCGTPTRTLEANGRAYYVASLYEASSSSSTTSCYSAGCTHTTNLYSYDSDGDGRMNVNNAASAPTVQCKWDRDETAPNGTIGYSTTACTNQNVTVTAQCQDDRLTSGLGGDGCAVNKTVVASTNIASGTLPVLDVAGNSKSLPYMVDWIDKTAPTVGGFEIKSQKASTSNIFSAKAFDADSPSGSVCNVPLTYTLTITGPAPKILTGTIPRDGNIIHPALNITKSGNYTYSFAVKDAAGNTSTATTGGFTIYPNEVNTKYSEIVFNGSTEAYANNSDIYTYQVTLRDVYNNPIYEKSLISANQNGTPTITTQPNGKIDALLEEVNSALTDSDGKATFTLKSLAPGKFDEQFEVVIPTWDDSYKDNGRLSITLDTDASRGFKKPFTGKIDITSVPNTLALGNMQSFKINTNTPGWSSLTIPTPVSMYLANSNSIHPTDSVNHKITLANFSTAGTFDGRLEAITSAGLTTALGITISPENYQINYVLGNENVSYNLTAQDGAEDNTPLSIGGTATSGIKIVGNMQAQGKSALANVGTTNFSDISLTEARAGIHRAAYQAIRNMTSGQILNKVRYVEGQNVTLNTTSTDYETLIVKNGNVIISGEYFNQSKKKFGIIVLRDNATDTSKGNVYITPGVRYIYGIIYADGSIHSADSSGKPYLTDSATRTTALSNQLVLEGTLFTKNTIGGAIDAGVGTAAGKYKLPGNIATNDFNAAMSYDLALLRRGNTGYDKNSSAHGTKDLNYNNTTPTVIIYSSKLSSDAPKGFIEQ